MSCTVDKDVTVTSTLIVTLAFDCLTPHLSTNVF